MSSEDDRAIKNRLNVDERALRKLASTVLFQPASESHGYAIEQMRIYLERTAAQINIAQVDANHHQSMQHEASETVLLREQLVQEQAIRRRREEYNQLAKQVMELPSDLLMQIEQVKGETENIRQRQRDLDTQVAEYRVKVGRILQQLECLRDEMKE